MPSPPCPPCPSLPYPALPSPTCPAQHCPGLACPALPFLVSALIILIIICLFLSAALLLLWIRPPRSRVRSRSSGGVGKGPPTPRSCRINSFTFLQLKGGEQEQTPRSLVEGPKLEEVKLGQKVKSEYIQSTEESGKFRRFASDLYKGASKTSLGVTNSISHSSYNSANEELQFDLYDYDTHGMDGQPTTFDLEDPANPGHLWDAFSLADFAPTKLFPSDSKLFQSNSRLFPDDQQSLAETPPDQDIELKTRTPVHRRGREEVGMEKIESMVESVTSDLTSSITSDLSQDTIKDEESYEFWNRSRFKPKTNLYQERANSTSQTYKNSDNINVTTWMPSENRHAIPQNNPEPPFLRTPEPPFLRTSEPQFLRTSEPSSERATPTLDINSDTKHFTDYYSFPPITLIDDLEVWDDDDESDE